MEVVFILYNEKNSYCEIIEKSKNSLDNLIKINFINIKIK